MEQTLAAYTARPSRVSQWLTWFDYREPAEFVESIPFTETRDYVQAVLAQRGGVSAPLRWEIITSLRPRRRDPIHPCIRDHLPQVLIRMGQRPQQHPFARRVVPQELHRLLLIDLRIILQRCIE